MYICYIASKRHSLTVADPKRYGMIVFPGFQALDVFGPLDVLNILSHSLEMNLSIIAQTLDPVSTKLAPTSSFGQSIVPTHTFDQPPADIDVLFVPGGFGTRAPGDQLAPMLTYIRSTYPKLRYLISVCTGATLLARSGVLDGKTATNNKRAWHWATSTGPRTNWVAKARWVEDGNIWTSSGVSAGIDATLAWMAKVYGEDVAQIVGDAIEHESVMDPQNDPFAAANGCADVPPKVE